MKKLRTARLKQNLLVLIKKKCNKVSQLTQIFQFTKGKTNYIRFSSGQPMNFEI